MGTLTITIDTDRLAKSGDSLAETLAAFAADYGSGGAGVVWTPSGWNVGSASWKPATPDSAASAKRAED